MGKKKVLSEIWQKRPANLRILVENYAIPNFKKLTKEQRIKALSGLTPENFKDYADVLTVFGGSVYKLLETAGYNMSKFSETWKNRENLISFIEGEIIPDFKKMTPEQKRRALTRLYQKDFKGRAGALAANDNNVYKLLKKAGYAKKYDIKPWQMKIVPHGTWLKKENLRGLIETDIIPNFNQLTETQQKERLKSLRVKDFKSKGYDTALVLAAHHKLYEFLKKAGYDESHGIRRWHMKSVGAKIFEEPENIRGLIEEDIIPNFKQLTKEEQRKELVKLTPWDFKKQALQACHYDIYELLKKAGYVEIHDIKPWHLTIPAKFSKRMWRKRENIRALIEEELIPNFNQLTKEEQKEKLTKLKREDFKERGFHGAVKACENRIYKVLKKAEYTKTHGITLQDMRHRNKMKD